MTEYYEQTENDKKLVSFVLTHTEQWRDHRNSNYLSNWERYERLWRGKWHGEDKTRLSERSRVVSPVLQQAVEVKQAEIDEAIFGRGQFFDIEDNFDDSDKQDIELTKNFLTDRFKRDRIRQAISQIITLGEVYGTGIGELVITQKTERMPATQPAAGGLAMVGVEERERVAVTLKPVNPKNFLIDPMATTSDEGLGCAIEEFVGMHTVVQGMSSGTYLNVRLGTHGATDSRLEVVQDETNQQQGRVKVLRYYGLVPRKLLAEEAAKDNIQKSNDAMSEDEPVAYDPYSDYEDMVEALVVIANDGQLLKKEESPFMMGDRPIVAYQSDHVPGRFWGRGTAEKAFNMQVALDGQLRAHLDSLALTSAPMMGMDATRLPRGFKFEIGPGKSILTNGNPAESLMPFNFGQTSPVNIQTAQLFERMLMQATGTMDSAGMPDAMSGDARTGAMSMALSGLIKRNKRTLVAFQEDFLIPLVKKSAWRYMQFCPDELPSKDFEFIPTASLGMMAREYEQQQYLSMMSTLGPDSPVVPMLLESVVDSSSLSNREKLKGMLQQLSQQKQQEGMQAAQAQAQQAQAQAQLLMAQAEALKADAMKKQAEAQRALAEAKLMPYEVQAKVEAALRSEGEDPSAEESEAFNRQVKIMELDLKQRDLDIKAEDIASNERIAHLQAATQAITTKNKESDPMM